MSESQGNKRPADRDPSPARPNKVSKTQAAAGAARYAEEIVENCEPFEEGDIDETIGYQSKPPDDEWTQAQEDRVIEIFQSSGMEQAGRLMFRGGEDMKKYPVLLASFKICLRVFGVTPVELISPRYNLGYQAKGNRGKGSPHILSAPFCTALSGLIVHPNIGRDPCGLLCLLQFAVICRLDIRRPWVIPLIPNDCPVLSQLGQQMEDREGGLLDEPVSLMHRKLRESTAEKGENCSRISDYLNRISEICAQDFTPVLEPDDGSYFHFGSPYKPIAVEDILVVVKAIETTPIENSDYKYLVHEALKTYREIKKGHEFPSADQLGDVWERSQKQVLRYLIQRADTRPRTPENEAPADNQEGNTGPAGSEPEETSPVDVRDVEMATVPESEETDPFVAQDVDMDEQCSEDEEERRRQLAEEKTATSPEPEPESDGWPSNGGPFTPPVLHRLRRPSMRLSDLGPLSPMHGSSNPFLIRTGESNELSVRRAEEIESLREVIQELEDGRAQDREKMQQMQQLVKQMEDSRVQDREVILGLREEIKDLKTEARKQNEKIDQVLQRVEEQNAKLFLHLQRSNSRGVAATVDPTAVASPETACSPETLVGNTQDNVELPGTSTNKDVPMDEAEAETEPQDKADTVQHEDDLPSKNIVRTNLEFGSTRPQVIMSQIGVTFRSGIGSMQTRGGTGGTRTYNPLFNITHTEQVERKNRV